MVKAVQFGKSAVVANPLGLGTNAVGGYNLFPGLDDGAGRKLVDAAIANGINLLDTAYVYGLGHSEQLVGQVVKDHRREELVIATKGAHDFSTGREVIRNDPDFITQQVDQSLKRLGVDYIDIYYLHFPDHDTPKAEAVGALQRLREAGKIRAIGISNFNLDQIKEANADGYVDVVEDEFSLLHQDHLTEGMLDYLRDHQISFVPYFPLASGLLTGKYVQDVSFPADDIRSQIADFKQPRYGKILAAVDQVRPIADRHGATVAQTILAWYLQNQLITAVIPGAKRADQVISNAQAMNIQLTAEEYQTIETAFADFKANKSGKSLKDPD
ncbi:MAG: aldo/keto reductase [Limosilactobacillus oris]|jgi:aryl-alcohol dehydrogenase-like predicted oxidoreductase|uniref:aldo/keto reductase n=1 Tax=Limosilactobacillus oris TaxID=1632 RepID=UPI00174DAD8A|nr:aldo/keto reductase [Limosilactobacillus oris]MCH3910387.1 aldo/keto reductase [Limosilactobacillus oris]MCH3939513.1 aldo/keto reductase [Limosilactobacillus oris]MCI1980917.1 aldo/keto reductase [Limosilactobacillus oris]UXC67107.1 aldo/keto reductase [Limosilactobacillus oris]